MGMPLLAESADEEGRGGRVTDAIDYYERFRDVADEDWWKLWLAYAADPTSRDDLPGFPPAEIQQRVHGTVFAGAMSGALSLRYLSFRFVRNVLMRPIVPTMKVFDFGCGWGRVQRVLLQGLPHREPVRNGHRPGGDRDRAAAAAGSPVSR